ncbi:hypothetical protein M5238_001248 [Vibrio vulnificus]|uniref:TRAFAC clade GTPase domain-containing protein n=1 Tax=Vibrio parahaemolyticus TaxID=670 RepID=UPI00111EA21F|nr:hypothetical protein [Vibrio parahaemolyticus]EJC6736190.1 hypothetical protein [Vibrio vulnificus]EJE8546569.1 hypothetical protein [Vibrio vulnificus]TOK34023.1 hypothetical protein CGI19_17040 [Vibrio parahaemolyticus]TOK54155.1 hypothetical protein CGI16_18635 [Vibrio parahaemolyticus]
MSSSDNSILLIGESDVGKTHYGAQLLKRLMKRDGQLRMNGAATNLEPFESAMNCLDEGMAAGHTAAATYVDSIWPITDAQGHSAELIWPDYGGEQIKAISDTRRIPKIWQSRVDSSPAWLFIIRLQKTRINADIFSRPLHEIPVKDTESQDIQMSDQAKLIELLQMLLYIRGVDSTKPLVSPRLCVLLSCWDELGVEEAPPELLKNRLPMLSSFIHNTWANPSILGLSALGQALSHQDPNDEYSNRGPEQFGYVVLPDGQHSPDLTIPIQYLLDENF